MRRTIIVTSCLAVLCLAALAVWVYRNHAGPGVAPVTDGNGKTGTVSQTSPGPDEKPATAPPVFGLPVRVAYLGDDRFGTCYADFTNRTIYLWRDVVIPREQVPNAGPSGRFKILTAKDFTVVPFNAPVKYLESGGGYKPGYLDRSGRVFYAWKGVSLSQQEVPYKSRDGEDSLADPNDFRQVIEIDMPAHLKDQPELWKKT